MPSGKSSRQRRHSVTPAPPPVRSKGGPRRQASPRVLAAAGAVVVAVAVAVVLAVVLTRSPSSISLKDVPTVGSLANGLPEAADVQALFKGIPQHGTTLGRPSAPVTMVEFIDAQCPYCQEFETQVLPTLVKKYVRSGTLKISMEPWAFIGPDSVRGQAAELAAASQNRAFDFAELLYDNQGEENTGWLDDSMIVSVAKSIPGLRVHTLLTERSSSAVKAAQQKVDAQAETQKVTGTPTLFVGKSGTQGKEVDLKSPTDEQSVVAAITAAAGNL
jgi:protein-disulfide isomerase